MDSPDIYRFTDKMVVPIEADIPVLERLTREYPYFQNILFVYLKAVYLYDSERFEDELEKISIFIRNRKALFYYIFSEEYSRFFRQTGKEDLKEDRTSILLDAFFESRGDVEYDLEYNILNPNLAAVDYFSYMQSQPKNEDGHSNSATEDHAESSMKHQDIIDNFIIKTETEGEIRIHFDPDSEDMDSPPAETDEKEDELDEDMFFTETLAKIYIKQKKYEKAYKIIKHLSLNYPKKNIYFADQLSFLEKLIINSKHKDTK